MYEDILIRVTRNSVRFLTMVSLHCKFANALACDSRTRSERIPTRGSCSGMRECEKMTKKRERKEGKKEMLVISLVRGGRLVPSLYARIVKKARRFIRRTTIEIGPACDRPSRKHVVGKWRRKKRGLDKKQRLLNGTRLYARGSSRRSHSRSSLYFWHKILAVYWSWDRIGVV